jgi:hypothetical protein
LFIPWCISIPFQTGVWLNVFTNWASLLFISTANFVLPYWLFYLSQQKARTLRTLELAKETSLMAESNGKRQFTYTHSFHPNNNNNDQDNNKNSADDDNNNNNNDKILPQYYTREPISLPPRPQSNPSTSTQEKSLFQKHLDKHFQKLEKQKLENPQLEKLRRPKLYRHMSADAVPIDELPDIINNDKNDDDNTNDNMILSPTELYENEKSNIISYSSTPRSVSTSTEDEEFYNLFNYGKSFKAFPGTSKKFNMIISLSAASISIILIGGIIVYDFVGLANGRNFFDLDINT